MILLKAKAKEGNCVPSFRNPLAPLVSRVTTVVHLFLKSKEKQKKRFKEVLSKTLPNFTETLFSFNLDTVLFKF